MINPYKSFCSLANVFPEDFIDKPHKSLQVSIDSLAYTISAIAYKVLAFVSYYIDESLYQRFDRLATHSFLNAENRSSTYSLFQERVINFTTNFSTLHQNDLSDDLDKLYKKTSDSDPSIDKKLIYLSGGGICTGMALDFSSRFYEKKYRDMTIKLRTKQLSKLYEFGDNAKASALQMLLEAQNLKNLEAFKTQHKKLPQKDYINKTIGYILKPLTKALGLKLESKSQIPLTAICPKIPLRTSLKKAFQDLDDVVTLIIHHRPHPQEGHTYCLIKENQNNFTLLDPNRGFLSPQNSSFEGFFSKILENLASEMSYTLEDQICFYKISSKT